MKKSLTRLISLLTVVCILLLSVSCTDDGVIKAEDGNYFIPEQYSLGDTMHDFEIITPEGESIKLSEALDGKRGILLNFWFTTCTYCIKEFPYLDSAAQKYKDDITVLCLNTSLYDSDDTIAIFKQNYNLSLTMAKADPLLFSAFGTTGYPTSVMIDRYGKVCLIESGAYPSEEAFVTLFEYFSADDYESTALESVSDIFK